MHEFIVSFLWICKKLKICRTGRNDLLQFIRILLPINSKIPKTYNALIKSKKLKKPIKKLICSNCYNDLNSMNHHACEKTSENFSSFNVIEFDIKDQLTQIIKKEWDTMNKYQSILLMTY